MRKTKQRPTPVPAWAHRIWMNQHNGAALILRMPKDGNELAALVREHSELVAAVAWAAYVIEGEGKVYHLGPVERAVECNGKNGKWIEKAEDHGAVTTFPLASFLSVSEGFVFKAKEELADIAAWRERKHDPIRNAVRKVLG